MTLPDVGGDTIWVDAGLAYEALADNIKDRLAGLHVAHDFRATLTGAGHDYPVVAHPIVRQRRETGKPILWVNFTQHPSIIGLDQAEGKELLTLIIDQYRKPEHQVRFSWRPTPSLSGTTGLPCTTQCATMATFPDCSSGSSSPTSRSTETCKAICREADAVIVTHRSRPLGRAPSRTQRGVARRIGSKPKPNCASRSKTTPSAMAS